MKKLSKEQIKARDEIAAKLRAAQDEVEAVINEANQQIQVYNTLLEEARTWSSDVGSEIRSFFDEKSEKWQEGEAGSATDSWAQEFEDFDPSTIDEIDEPDFAAPDDMENLSESPS